MSEEDSSDSDKKAYENMSLPPLNIDNVTDGSNFDPIDPWSYGFVHDLDAALGSELADLLADRRRRSMSRFVPSTLDQSDPALEPTWRCSPPPNDLVDRRVEITGPAVDYKMVAKAMASGAQGYMIDSEDSLSPTWTNVLATQRNIFRLVHAPRGAHPRPTIHYRPRGLHLQEAHFGTPAALFDFGMFAYWNARDLVERGSGPYLYLPKLEHEHEANWWCRAMDWVEDRLELPKNTFRCTVLVETLPALLRIEAIVYALKTRLTGLNVGRWDYAFSCIKTLGGCHEQYTVPDASAISMTTPQMLEYARWVVHVAHARGCHAIGGMAAQVPNRKDPNINGLAMAAVAIDKKREVELGHDGTWVAHPDLIPVALAAFDSVLQGRVEQKTVMPTGPTSLDTTVICSSIDGAVTKHGISAAARAALLYLDAWLDGRGCVALDGKMEDAATCEVSRCLLWLWARGHGRLDDGEWINGDIVIWVVRGEAAALGAGGIALRHEGVELLIDSITSPSMPDFITIPAYNILAKIVNS